MRQQKEYQIEPRGETGRRVRVLLACDHIAHDGALHGGGRQLIELTRALEESDAVEPVVCVLRGAGDLGGELQREGLPFRFFGDRRFNPISLWKLIRLIRTHEIQALHLTDFGASTFGRLAGYVTGTPAVVQVITHHSEHQPRGFPGYVRLAYRILAPFTSRALAISSSVKEFAVREMGFSDDQVEVLHYPLPRYSFSEPSAGEVEAARRRHGVAADAPVVGAVTRFHAVKGIRFLIEAFALVGRDHPGARLMLVGRGPEEPELRDRAERLGIGDRVIFAGFRRDVQAYVSLFDVSVVPSLEEGFGLVALESLALGVPVVASREGGLPDIVSDGVTGFLVPAGDSAAIAEKVRHLLERPALRSKMSRAARKESRRFSVDRYAGRLEEIYRSLAAEGS